MLKKSILAALAGVLSASLCIGAAEAKDLNKIGISLGSMGNPFFVALAKGAEDKAKEINPNVQVQALGFDYDLGKQVTQVDNFIASGVDMIMLNAADQHALAPAIKKAQAAGVVVVAVDVGADGVDATVQTDNVQAGEISCQYIVDKLGGKGNVIIQNGPQVSAVVDRVKGCKQVFAKNPDIKVLSDDQDAKGSREGALNVMQGHLTRFPEIDAVFAINDPQAIGTDLAAKQLNRKGIIITSVDGAPDIEAALKGDTQIEASASQDPYKMAKMAVEIGYDIMNGKQPETKEILMPSKLVTRDNVDKYEGWTSH
ncbi:ABC transporter substrate-binding protein [Consotaella salsifontis]|uniref:Monosaccharide ABC transporter substrate-binding protein, CUT2 family n=1 Tax=Consotaella salsifontis TaxID=1365950 RepID=A0A1T4R8Y8_9HYPH|nr:ABC transporter substrate-binding protein [Consotaella salsifontis]SKA12081.1 monosaccharide ABC transporter substrate-binding protein, CUT2 family [Consotaella salsifontis]